MLHHRASLPDFFPHSYSKKRFDFVRLTPIHPTSTCDFHTLTGSTFFPFGHRDNVERKKQSKTKQHIPNSQLTLTINLLSSNKPTFYFVHFSMVLCGPGAHHRNSIAGSSVPRPIQRIRKGGPLVISSDGPYFSNTTQFYNVFSFNQAES